MRQSKIRVGIVGANVRYGWGTRAHIPALKALPEFELAAVCTAHKETAQTVAQEYGFRHVFTDYQEMAAHPDVDLVTVCVRVPFHHQMVMAALNAGKHIFCEWPLGANLTEAQAMVDLARRKGIRQMVGLQARASPGLLRLKELMDEGYVGEVLAVNMTMFGSGLLQRTAQNAYLADRKNGANSLTISTGHAIDALRFCLGEFREVSAQVGTQVRQWQILDTKETVTVDAPDNVLVSGVLASGAVVSVHVASIPWHGSGWRMEVYGREGTLVATNQLTVQFGKIQLRGAQRGERALSEIPVPSRLTWVPPELPVEPFNVAQMYRLLAQGIREGREVAPDFGVALQLHRLLDVIQRSSDQGKRLLVPEAV